MGSSRRAVVGGLVVIAALASTTTEVGRPTPAEAALIRAINAERTPRGLAPLRVDLRLEQAARAKSSEMLRTGTFAHGDVRARLVRFGARGPTYGENLAWASGSNASVRIVRMWMESPGHRANILRASFTRIGLGRRVGPFAGYGSAAVVTADFAG
jgi:uncharacterized protein YkwD